jgi:ACS family sodium-dependent inorganic phosphate cotransporter-like MFS transporter 9
VKIKKKLKLKLKMMQCSSLVAMGACLMAASLATQHFHTSLGLFTLAMAARGFHHGGVAVNPHDFAPNHTGSVFGRVFFCFKFCKKNQN